MNIAKLAILATVFVQDSSAKSNIGHNADDWLYYDGAENADASYSYEGVEDADILDLDT